MCLEGMGMVLLTVDASPETVSVCETCMKTRSVNKCAEGMNMVLLSVVLLSMKMVLLRASEP